jgi:hypothetical protein
MGHSKQNRCVPLQISRWGHAAISKLTKLQTRIEDETSELVRQASLAELLTRVGQG